MATKTKKATKKTKESSTLKARKDWHIVHNEHDIVIRKGDDLSEIPEVFLPSLKAEGVI